MAVGPLMGMLLAPLPVAVFPRTASVLRQGPRARALNVGPSSPRRGFRLGPNYRGFYVHAFGPRPVSRGSFRPAPGGSRVRPVPGVFARAPALRFFLRGFRLFLKTRRVNVAEPLHVAVAHAALDVGNHHAQPLQVFDRLFVRFVELFCDFMHSHPRHSPLSSRFRRSVSSRFPPNPRRSRQTPPCFPCRCTWISHPSSRS